jgi:hypothetical protein
MKFSSRKAIILLILPAMHIQMSESIVQVDVLGRTSPLNLHQTDFDDLSFINDTRIGEIRATCFYSHRPFFNFLFASQLSFARSLSSLSSSSFQIRRCVSMSFSFRAYIMMRSIFISLRFAHISKRREGKRERERENCSIRLNDCGHLMYVECQNTYRQKKEKNKRR